METTLLIATGTLTTLLAGVFFGYATSVNGGLGKLKDSEYIRAMQSINIVIQNPLFFLSFMGPIVLLPLATIVSQGNSERFALLLAASVIYILGSFVLTVAGNVPLNDKLAALNVANASEAELRDARTRYEKPWNRLHAIRTVASIIAGILIFAACLA